jgi:hypothetical protein
MTTTAPTRIAMWSGPRNISTAMMRSWGNRDDCVVVDEPLYAYYLALTRKPHPGMEEVISASETDWRRVVERLTSEVPGGRRNYYQKHMTHHMLPGINRDWLGKLTNCFLIRDPKEVLASYVKIVETPTLEDTGFPQQADIFEFVRQQTGRVPPVIDAADVLRDPRRILGLLCDALRVAFQEAMLSWPPGPRATDGVWAKYWYGEVEKSTGFRPYKPKQIELPPRLQQLWAQCAEYYERLHDHRLR